ncbi:hypothetical protein N9J02_00740 [bacterium]|jgi:hypothetical protein|nr:hypothetical protein [bacterium]|tara:strand:- start:22 stop:198 length:177 start_codon:yes stop_codon:yes gene_type:complete
MLNKNMTTHTDILVREPQRPEEGEYTLDNFGNLVVFKEGRWVDMTKLTVSTSAFYDFE